MDHMDEVVFWGQVRDLYMSVTLHLAAMEKLVNKLLGCSVGGRLRQPLKWHSIPYSVHSLPFIRVHNVVHFRRTQRLRLGLQGLSKFTVLYTLDCMPHHKTDQQPCSWFI